MAKRGNLRILFFMSRPFEPDIASVTEYDDQVSSASEKWLTWICVPGLPRHLLCCGVLWRCEDQAEVKSIWNKSWLTSNNTRVWTASSLSRPFTVRYIPFSQTIEVLDTYCSTSNLITVDKNTFPEDSKESTYFGSSYPYNLVLGVEDPGKPTLGCFSTDFRKLNILIEESVYQVHTIS